METKEKEGEAWIGQHREEGLEEGKLQYLNFLGLLKVLIHKILRSHTIIDFISLKFI